MRWWSLILLSAWQYGHGAEPADLDFAIASSLPRAVSLVLISERERFSAYVLSAHLNPYYLQGDFDADGSTDTAILLKERATGKSGILIVGSAGRISVLGAGRALGNGGDDFRWMDAWQVYPRGEVERGADGGQPPVLRGDALLLEKTESASGVVYWSGDQYAWYQQGD